MAFQMHSVAAMESSGPVVVQLAQLDKRIPPCLILTTQLLIPTKHRTRGTRLARWTGSTEEQPDGCPLSCSALPGRYCRRESIHESDDAGSGRTSPCRSFLFVSCLCPNTRIVGRFDPDRMAQAFSNLIGNAVKLGDLQHPIHVRLSESEHSVRFVVNNLGKPIPPTELPGLFDPSDDAPPSWRKTPKPRRGWLRPIHRRSDRIQPRGYHSREVLGARGTRFEVLVPSSKPASHHH